MDWERGNEPWKVALPGQGTWWIDRLDLQGSQMIRTRLTVEKVEFLSPVLDWPSDSRSPGRQQ